MENFFANNAWARESSFDHFWRHYAICDEWRQQHNVAVRQVQSQMYNPNRNVSQEVEMKEENYVDEPSEVTERLSRCEIRDEEEENEESGGNEEFLAFQAKTREHQKNLKEQRAAAEREKLSTKPWLRIEEEYVGVETISVHGRATQSAKHRNSAAEFQQRRDAAKAKYGEAAERILALESRLEMNFEKEFASNPQMWPNIPFRF